MIYLAFYVANGSPTTFRQINNKPNIQYHDPTQYHPLYIRDHLIPRLETQHLPQVESVHQILLRPPVWQRGGGIQGCRRNARPHFRCAEAHAGGPPRCVRTIQERAGGRRNSCYRNHRKVTRGYFSPMP